MPALNKIEIPIPRLHRRTGGIALTLIFALLVILSWSVMEKQLYLLRWMRYHDNGYYDGFEIEYFDETLRTAWLPTRLLRKPHHQLAIAASAMNIIASFLTLALFVASARTRKNLSQQWLLLLIFLPTLVVNTTAVIWIFVIHNVDSAGLDTLGLWRYASAVGYPAYGVNYLDFESWSCGIAQTPAYATRHYWRINCHYSRVGRWLLVPVWLVLNVAILLSWLSFRGLAGWKEHVKEVEDAPVNPEEGKVRLR